MKEGDYDQDSFRAAWETGCGCAAYHWELTKLQTAAGTFEPVLTEDQWNYIFGYSLYIHYDVSSWYQAKDRAIIKIESIGFYDDFVEYETARLKGLHSTEKSDIPNIN